MEFYLPKIIYVNPLDIIPHHQPGRLIEGIVLDYIKGRYVPPIPILRSPRDLRAEGNFVNYNGHHRTKAARRVLNLKKDFKAPCILLEDDEDICYLIANPPEYNEEVYPELINDLGIEFEKHKNHVLNEARDFRRLVDLDPGYWGYPKE